MSNTMIFFSGVAVGLLPFIGLMVILYIWRFDP